MRSHNVMKRQKDRVSTMIRMKRCKTVLPLLALFLAVAAVAVFAQDAGKKEPPVAMVIRINGSLEYRTGANEDWQVAAKNTPLLNGYQIRTGLGNKAVIVYTSSGTRVLINENTELEITSQNPGKRGSAERTKLIVGEVYNKVREKKAAGYSYEVETPSSVASVRGTEFNAQFGNGQATFLSMLNSVEVMNQLGSVLIQQYQRTRVPEGGAPQDPQTLSKGDAEKQTGWTGAVEPIWNLKVVPGGGNSQAIGTTFNLTVWAENAETGSIDPNASFVLSAFNVTGNAVEFSTDGGKTFGGAPSEVQLSNGQVVLMARGVSEGSVTMTAEAPDCEPGTVAVSVSQPKQKKTLQLKFSNPDGSGEKTLKLELEEK